MSEGWVCASHRVDGGRGPVVGEGMGGGVGGWGLSSRVEWVVGG
jgi:hypothetical protein